MPRAPLILLLAGALRLGGTACGSEMELVLLSRVGNNGLRAAIINTSPAPLELAFRGDRPSFTLVVQQDSKLVSLRERKDMLALQTQFVPRRDYVIQPWHFLSFDLDTNDLAVEPKKDSAGRRIRYALGGASVIELRAKILRKRGAGYAIEELSNKASVADQR